MTEQAHPDYNADMERQRTATRVAEARIADLEKLVDQQRYELDVMAMRLDAARAAYDRLREALEEERSWKRVAEIRRAELAQALATIAALERRLAEAQQGLTVAEGG